MEVNALNCRIQSLVNTITTATSASTSSYSVIRPARFNVKYTKTPFYLFGRYLKRARDVPGNSGVRIGRHSVEEIICHQIRQTLAKKSTSNHNNSSNRDNSNNIKSSFDSSNNITDNYDSTDNDGNSIEVKMHACGREDIDVRMLGKGRPFAIQLQLPSYASPTIDLLEEIRNTLNSGEGLNDRKDIHVPLLTSSNERLWTTMQEEAGKKNKGYRCVAYSSKPILNQETLTAAVDALKRSCCDGHYQEPSSSSLSINRGNNNISKSNNIDSSAITTANNTNATTTCGLHICQKTPLRVLHRRSLLDRPREVQCLKTTLLTPHFFILDLVTTAGTYVKEFVHGDLGRTVPNIGSILNCEAHILQLDVIRLYDHFPGHNDNIIDSSVIVNDGRIRLQYSNTA